MPDVDGFLEALAAWEPVHKLIVDRRTATKYLLSLHVAKKRSGGRTQQPGAMPSTSHDTFADGPRDAGTECDRDELLLTYTDCLHHFYQNELTYEGEGRQKTPSVPWRDYFRALRQAMGRSGNIGIRFEDDGSLDLLNVCITVPGRSTPCTFQLMAVHDPSTRAKRIAGLTLDMAVQTTQLLDRLRTTEEHRAAELQAELERERARSRALQAQLSLYGGVGPPPADLGARAAGAGPGSPGGDGRKRKAPKSLFVPTAKMTVPQGAKIKPQ
eukprot:EG_transcript_20535